MRILSVPRWLIADNNGAGWLPNVTLIANDLTGDERRRVINNETVHQLQQDELGYFRWVFMYLGFLLRYGYLQNPFEIDSRDWDEDLDNRPPRYWKILAG